LGEWAELILGETVTPGFRDEHIAPAKLTPIADVPVWIGHDGGHTPTSVIGQSFAGEVRIYAALSSTEAGTRQHLETLVRPWLALHAPWTRSADTLLNHRVDPAMQTGEQGDIDQDPCRVIREMLGGSIRPGAIAWPARLEPGTALLHRFNVHTGRPALQIDREGGALLIRALRGRWYFPTVHGQVSRDLPVKSHPWSDLGDSWLYLVGGMAPSRERQDPKRWQRYATTTESPWGGERSRRREGYAESATRW
jgi:hypothetical protein